MKFLLKWKILQVIREKKYLNPLQLMIIDFQFNTPEDQTTGKPETLDGVILYANRILSLGCYYLEYSDGIREGDESRVLRCWKYLLPLFHNAQRNNYAIESLTFFFQNDFLLSPCQAVELMIYQCSWEAWQKYSIICIWNTLNE